MKLATKLTLALALSFLVIFLISLIFVARQEIGFADALAERNNRLVARVLTAVVQETRVRHGEAEARSLIQLVDRYEPNLVVRWIALDERDRLAVLDANQVGVLRQGHLVDVYREGVLETWVPVFDADGAARNTLLISRTLAARDTHLVTLLLSLVGVLFVALGVGIVVTVVLGRRLVGRPVERLCGRAEAIGQGDLSARIELGGNDELARLAQAMNLMATRLEQAQRERQEAQTQSLRHAERLSMLGQLASGAAHEIRSPLHVIAMRAEILGRRLDDAELAAQSVAVIGEQAEHIGRIVEGMLGFARRQPSRRQVHSLRELAEHSLELLRMVRTEHPIEMRCELESGLDPAALVAEVDFEQIRQVLSNLVLNAAQAMPQGGCVTVRLGRERRAPPGSHGPERDFVCIAVEDEGCGIAPEVIERLFEPFFTTKGEGKGTGLGLAISRGIVEEHGGFIEVDSEPGRGTTFRIYLPAAPRDPC